MIPRLFRVAALLLCLVFMMVPAMADGGLANSPWPKYGYDLNNTGRSPFIGSQDATVKWIYPAPGNFTYSSPVIGPDGTIYIPNYGDKNLYAINPDGSVKWTYYSGGNLYYSPAIGSDGTIYFGDYTNYNLTALNPDGTRKWNFTTGGSVQASPAIGPDGTIYVPGYSSNKLYALNPDGTEKWNFTTGGGMRGGSPAIGPDGTIYIGTYADKKLWAVNPDGTEKWTFTTGGSVYNQPAIGADGTIYVTSYTDKKLWAVNPDGTEKWNFTTGYSIAAGPAVGSDGTIYIGSRYANGKFFALNSDGTQKWNFTTSAMIPEAPAIGADGTIYFGTYSTASGKTRNFYALNPDATQKWIFTLGTGLAQDIQGSPAIGSDGTVYVATKEGKLYAFNGVVDYTADQTAGKETLAVQFTGTSTVSPSSWSWDFGDGGTSTLQSPSHTYTSPGSYTVNLSIVNQTYGTTNYLRRTGYIKVYSAPTAAFTTNVTGGFYNLPVSFTDQSTNIPTAWNWSFGDGSYASSQNATHTYTAPGNFTVNLTVTNPAGSNTTSKKAYIAVSAPTIPVASFTANQTGGIPGLAVQFTDSSTLNPTAWNWSFGDATYSELRNPVHTYSSAGSYDVSLNASNSYGSNILTKTGYITIDAPAAPVANLTVSHRVGLAPLAVQFNDTSAHYPTSWSWNFGDSSSTSALKNPSHTYTSAGNYTVTLTATNAQGTSTNTSTYPVTVLAAEAPLSNFHFINIYTANDEGVRFDVPNGVFNSGGAYTYVPNTYWVMFRNAGGGTNPMRISALSSSWNAADRTTTSSQSGHFWISQSGGQQTMHNGILMIAVNGTIPDDFKVHIKSTGEIFDVGSPDITNIWQFAAPGETQRVTGVDQTFDKNDFIYGTQSWKPDSTADRPIFYGEDQTDPINQFHIMFVDLRAGTCQNTSLPDNGQLRVDYSFTNLSGRAVFNAYGWYMRSNHGTGVIMTSNNDACGYTVDPVTSPPAADFAANSTSAPVGSAVQFTDKSTNAPTSWSWDFGDGGVSSLQNPAHTYTTAGTYTVKLTATNGVGPDTVSKLSYIAITQPLPTYNDIYVAVANTAGPKYNSFSNNTYHILFQGAGQGLNALHISTDPTANYGQVTISENQSGTFYATDSGGKGYEDEIILMVAVNGTLPDDFRMTINSDGYTWTPNTASNTAPTADSIVYQSSALSQTFSGSDFRYGPQIWKPTADGLNYPIYSGQDMSNTANTFQLMFVDLNSGVLHPDSSLMNNGAVRINYSFQNLTSFAAFSVYGYCKNSNAGADMIGWTNALTSDKTMSGYSVVGTGGSVGPVAGFTANTTVAAILAPIQFTDTSTGVPTSWSWDFGDSSTSAEQNPVHAYSSAGTYTVKLTATNDKGSNTVTRSNYITVSESAGTSVASFTASVVNGVAPLTVTFTDTSTNTPTGWTWDFGDGGASSYQNPTHTYGTAGTYTVKLSATNSKGSTTHSASSLIYVANETGALPDYHNVYIRTANHDGIQWDTTNNGTYYVPSASKGSGLASLHISTDASDNTGKITETVSQDGTFYAISSDYQDDVILLVAVNGTVPDNFAVRIRTSGYTWTPVSGSAPVSGTYQSAALDQTFTKKDLFYGPQNWKPTQGDVDYPLIHGEDMNSTAYMYQLMFIDTRVGAVKNTSFVNNGAVKIQYTFTNLPDTASFGVYGWKTAKGMGFTNEINSSGYIVVSPSIGLPAVADFAANQTEGIAPFNPRFKDTSLNTPTGWAWDFDNDGVIDNTKQIPDYTYTAAGTYSVKLTATNSKGSDTKTRSGYIIVTAPKETTNAFTLTGVNATTTGSAQTIAVNASNSTTSSNIITVTNVSSTWDHLNVALAAAPADDGLGNLTGTVQSVEAVAANVTVPIESLGNPNVTLSLTMSQVPNSTAAITSTISSDPDASVWSSFTLAASSQNKEIVATAYTVNFTKTDIANSGTGGIIQSANITMAVNHTWVEDNGGKSRIVVMHRSDAGKVTFLTTEWTGLCAADGNDYFVAVSPEGLSTFVLTAYAPVTTTTSSSSSSWSYYGGSDSYTYYPPTTAIPAVTATGTATATPTATPVQTEPTKPKVRITPWPTGEVQPAPQEESIMPAVSNATGPGMKTLWKNPLFLAAEIIAAIAILTVATAGYLKKRRRDRDPLRWDEK
ncbi:PKD domain-containing protein [Methanoregula formicica]|uniref:PDK repeat-containing protein n=1 Tax=Methanoregula formicica (strain DSM 22288 / NBRC 105244 / SMSP) TaxID=593750 RepID=L0HER4_METFS|nr:PKD domain-containing protein [Methanoregula formicica]AGB01803.1 PDK repeat-containing protein [Methanoregula formicica SMSP]